MWNLDADPRFLLTIEGNPKVDKGNKYGVWTAIMHLAPHTVSGANVCAYASAGCAAACLNLAGRGGMALDGQGLNSVQVARIQRTRLFKRNRDLFFAMLHDEIATHIHKCEKAGVAPAIRLNGTSDLPWERYETMRLFPEATFYDYTKWPIAKRDTSLPNYSLTFSLAEDNDENAIAALDAGVNVAVVFPVARSKDLPETWTFHGKTYPVIDGDVNDLRFLDPKGPVIVGLRAKGTLAMRAEGLRAGFVRPILPTPATFKPLSLITTAA